MKFDTIIKHDWFFVHTGAWLWQFGRRKPRLGGLKVEQTMARKSAVAVVLADEKHKKAVETKRRCKAAPA